MSAILMSDEGVHEIQLNGKQLVFMFMAVTVVSVVIFLCGVMVGRGVRAPRATELADAAIQTPLDPTASVATAPSSTAGTYPMSLRLYGTADFRAVFSTPSNEGIRGDTSPIVRITVAPCTANCPLETSAG